MKSMEEIIALLASGPTPEEVKSSQLQKIGRGLRHHTVAGKIAPLDWMMDQWGTIRRVRLLNRTGKPHIYFSESAQQWWWLGCNDQAMNIGASNFAFERNQRLRVREAVLFARVVQGTGCTEPVPPKAGPRA